MSGRRKIESEPQKKRLGDLVPHEFNPRDMTPEKRKQLKESIEQFGLMETPAVNTDNTIIAGHQRIKQMIEKHGENYEIWCMVPNRKMTDQEVEDYLIISNAVRGHWDFSGASGNHYDFKHMMNLGVDKKVLIKQKRQTKEDDFKTEINVPKTPKSKRGDLYIMNGHRLMCGDSTDLEDVEKLMDGEKAKMVFTDPPYNVDYSGRGKETSNTILNDKMSPEQFDKFLNGVFLAYKSITEETCPFYVCHSSSSQIAFEQSMNQVGLQVKCQIIWNKKVASMGWGDYRWKHEPIFYATYGGKNVDFHGDRTSYTVWNEEWDMETAEMELKKLSEKMEKGDSTVWTLSRDSNYQHPTQKPLQLIEIALKNSSNFEDLILDLFGGSGSTLMASDQMERRCNLMELDPKYCDVIVKRFVASKRKAGEPYSVSKNGKDITNQEWIKDEKK